MSPLPAVADIRTYLLDGGWRLERTWNDASVWSDAEGHEILLPPRDDMADIRPRVREILTVLTAVEQRPAEEIRDEISSPYTDLHLYRTSPEGGPDGFAPLPAALHALHGIREIVRTAARAVVEGQAPVFPRGTPRAVNDLLNDVQLGQARSGGHVFTVRMPLDRSPLGRPVSRQVYEAVAAVRDAVAEATERDLTPFDGAVAAGVSANLCEALSELAGRRQEEPFDIAFRWGRGLASGLRAETVRFAAGAGRVVRAAAAHLRETDVSGDGVVTGVVEGLYDRLDDDRWRIRVRGELRSPGGSRAGRAVWVRLDGPASYERAIVAHRSRERVRAAGTLSNLNGRVELVVDHNDFHILRGEE